MSRSRRRSRRALVVACAIVVAVAAIGIAVSRRSPGARATAPTSTPTSVAASTTFGTAARRPAPTSPSTYHEVPLLTLGHAVADPAAGAFGDAVLFAGGLDASSTSTNRVGSIVGRQVQTLPSLPRAFHDSAGAALDASLYMFGGGDGVSQLDSILRVTPRGATAVGRLPAPSSDSLAATIGGRVYVVGGYTGARWLDTIVSYSPAGGVQVVAHLPVGLRYAAVATAGGRLIIAGGETPTAHASRAIYSFDPATAAVTLIGALPVAVSHAGAVGVGREVIVAGGQDEARHSLASITAINVDTDLVRAAGTLAVARSDAALVDAHGRLLLIGGRSGTTVLDRVSELVPVRAQVNVYAHDGANALNATAARARPLVYVPNSLSNTVDVIDPHTFRVVEHFGVGALPQHVTPSWDMRTLYVDNDHGNSLTPIDPRTGMRAGPDIPVTDPYNLYFTTDGRYAIVVAEARQRLDFRDAHTMQLVHSVAVPCRGIDHMDDTADGSLALASCEFSGQLVVIDLRQQSVRQTITLPHLGTSAPRPQDVKLTPDGTRFYVADMNANGVWEVDAHSFRVEGFVPTGAGAHGLYPSRDAKYLYVTNRDAGTISVLSFATGRVVTTWRIPGGSPDMGGVSADGKVLWVSGRYSGVVYAISTTDGHVIATIKVGSGPHGVCVWPQPGRFSIGHTGITR